MIEEHENSAGEITGMDVFATGINTDAVKVAHNHQ
jgi:hypothetical protein